MALRRKTVAEFAGFRGDGDGLADSWRAKDDVSAIGRSVGSSSTRTLSTEGWGEVKSSMRLR
jgi:hypothetical protein